MADELARLYAMARKRRITSLMHVVAGPDMNDESGVCGEFAEDLEYAAAVATDGFKLLMASVDQQQREPRARRTRTRSKTIEDELPFMLRVA